MNFGFVLIGLFAGICGGFFGIGGAVVMVPALVLLFDFTQHQAQGTTLAAMIPPIGLLAAWNYYNLGHVKILPAVFIALGFFFGGYLGSLLVGRIPPLVLKKLFGVFLFLISFKLIFLRITKVSFIPDCFKSSLKSSFTNTKNWSSTLNTIVNIFHHI